MSAPVPLFTKRRNITGYYSDEKYREWWRKKYGGFVNSPPSEEKKREFEKKLDDDMDYSGEGIKIYKRIRIKKLKVVERSNDGYIFDEPASVKTSYKYAIIHNTGREAWLKYDDARHTLGCETIEEVYDIIVSDFAQETSKW